MFGKIGILEIVVIAVVALVLIGPEKAPKVGPAIAKGIKGYKKLNSEITKSIDVTDVFNKKDL